MFSDFDLIFSKRTYVEVSVTSKGVGYLYIFFIWVFNFCGLVFNSAHGHPSKARCHCSREAAIWLSSLFRSGKQPTFTPFGIIEWTRDAINYDHHNALRGTRDDVQALGPPPSSSTRDQRPFFRSSLLRSSYSARILVRGLHSRTYLPQRPKSLRQV